MLAGVTIVDPAIDLDRADGRRSSPTSTSIRSPRCAAPPSVADGRRARPAPRRDRRRIGADVLVGPFCYLRPGTVLEAGAKAGTFVEIKNSHIGEGTKVPHLSYIGDADIGAGTNIGAGASPRTTAPSSAPASSGRRSGATSRPAFTMPSSHPSRSATAPSSGAGSVITEDVPPGSLAIARARQVTKEGYVDERG